MCWAQWAVKALILKNEREAMVHVCPSQPQGDNQIACRKLTIQLWYFWLHEQRLVPPMLGMILPKIGVGVPWTLNTPTPFGHWVTLAVRADARDVIYLSIIPKICCL